MSAYGARSYSRFTAPSVRASRARTHYVDCSVCGQGDAEYLFFRDGVRFVRCRGCGLVYVSPVGAAGPCYFDVAEVGQLVTARDRALALGDFTRMIARFAEQYAARHGRPPRRTLLLGRYFDELSTEPALLP